MAPTVPAQPTSTWLADRLIDAAPTHLDGWMAATLSMAAIALVDRHRALDLWPLGPLPEQATFDHVAGCDDHGKALCAALDAIEQRWPHTQGNLGPLRSGCERFAGTRTLTPVIEAFAAVDLSACSTGPGAGDLLGDLYGFLRSVGGKRHLGAFFTPGSISSLVAAVIPVNAGDAVLEPAMGTGSLLRAAVQDLVGRGVDPWQVGWFGIDLDRVAVALASLNAIVWGLGPHVWFHAGDGLVDRFVTPSGAPIRFAVTLANPPWGTTITMDRAGGGACVVVDAEARRRQMGLLAP